MSRGEGPNVCPGTLYVCATPIGHLEDITLRALRTLQEVDWVAAEDTRHTRKLLSAHGIFAQMLSLHEHNEAARTPRVLDELRSGKSVALVSDAGMPGISDPGTDLIAACIDAGHPVVPLPGPTAFVAALVVSGLPTERFAFEGFLPRAGKRRKERLAELAQEPRTTIFYEAPHRLVQTLQELADAWGERPAAVARELTKMHEEVVRGTLGQLCAHFTAHGARGEIVVLVGPAAEVPKGVMPDDAAIRAALQEEMAAGSSRRDAVRVVAGRLQVSRRHVYEIALSDQAD